ncbi:sensor domain-containing diguanylate cyclase [Vibrio sp. RC27]
MNPLQQQLLNTIMMSKVIDGGLLDEASDLIVTSLIAGLEIQRAGIWLDGDSERSYLHSQLVIDKQHRTRDTALQLNRDNFPRYFSALDDEIVICANDAVNDPLTSEFCIGYLDVLNIKSMLDAPIRRNGVTVGVVCCEHMNEVRTWTEGDIVFTSVLADQFGRALAAADKIAQFEQLRTTSRELDAQTNRLTALHKSLNHFSLISTTDAQGVITEINDNFLHIAKFTREEVIGQTHRIFKSKHQSPKFYADMWHQLIKGQVWQGDICNRTKTGELFWLHSTISPIKNVLGQTEGYIGFAYDITREIEAKIQLNEAEKISKLGSFRCHQAAGQWVCSTNFHEMLDLTLNQSVTWSYLASVITTQDFEPLKLAFDNLGNGDEINTVVCFDVDKKRWFSVTALLQGEWVIGSFQDISTRYLQDKQLNEIIALQNTILDSGNFTIIVTRPDGTITHFNKTAERLLEYRADELINCATPHIFHIEEELVQYTNELNQELNTTVTPGFETLVLKPKMGIVDERVWTYVTKNGHRFPVSVSVTSILNKSDEIIGYMGIGKDLTKQMEVEKYSNQLQQIMHTAGDIALFSGFLYEVGNAEFFITNDSFRNTIDESNSTGSLTLNQILDLFPNEEKLRLTQALEAAILYQTKFEIQAKVIEDTTLSTTWLQVVGTPQLNESNQVGSVIGFIQDITSQKELEEKLSSLALTDELTKIPNRRSLMANLTDEWKRHNRYQTMASILLIDVDKFKNVNDKWGHDAGDFVLKSITSIISSLLRESDIFGRFGGEEFLILAPNCDETETFLFAEKLRKAIEQHTIHYQAPMQLSPVDIDITVSIGVCALDGKIHSLNEWLVSADKSLYVAKKNGRNRTVIYSP